MGEKSTIDIHLLIKNIFLILLSILVVVAFIAEFESFLKSDIFSWFYSVESNYWLDFLIILTGIFYISIKVNECKNVIPDDKITLVLFLVIGVYTYERFFNTSFPFTYFESQPLSNIAYLDGLYVILFLQLINYIKDIVPSPKIKKEKNELLEDLPLENSNEDELGGLFEVSAKKIVKIIRNNKFRNSFTIGLNGEWGDGKTSVFNIVKNTLSNDDFVLIDFNPWMGFDKKVLIRDFFNSLSEELGADLSKEISKYVEEILNNGEESGILNFLKSVVKEDESIHSIFTAINKRIKLLDKKIVVFIDDVDRLDREEIFELLKLIRKTANFHNMFFIVAYDRSYVNESIKHQSSETTVKYLDKIINVEINLPYFDKFILKQYFLEKLEKMVPEELKYKIDYFKKRYEKDSLIIDFGFEDNDLFIYWLSNFREIKKVLNSLIVNYYLIYKEINFHDAIHLEILKLKHPYLYRLIFTKHTEIFGIDSNSNCYYLVPFDKVKSRTKRFQSFIQQNKQQNTNKEQSAAMFEFYVTEYCQTNNINDIEKEKILDLIKRLFPAESDGSFGYDVDDKGREGYLSVRYASKFERYFSHAVFKSNITELEFDKFLIMSSTEIINKIDDWILENKIKDLSWRLNRFDSFSNGVIYKNIVLASYRLLYENISGNMIDLNAFLYKLVDQDFLHLFGNSDNAKQFFINLFTNIDGNSYSKSSTVLYELLKKNKRRTDGKFPLSDDEIMKILKENVRKYLQRNNLFTEDFWNIYYKSLNVESNGTKKPDNNTINTIKDFLNSIEQKEDFIRSLITVYGYEGYRIRHEDIVKIFNCYVSFENFIFSGNESSEIIDEFKNFYNNIKDNNWDAINFQFEKIDVSHLD